MVAFSALALPRLPPPDQGTSVLPVVHMHTGSETLRLALAWCPEVVGPAVQAKESYLCQHLTTCGEPRGHRDLTLREVQNTHLGVLFLHDEDHSSMCSLAMLALGRLALNFGLMMTPPLGTCETCVNVYYPCRMVACESGRSRGPVRFHGIPALVLATGNTAQPGRQLTTLTVSGLDPAQCD